jgi:hypothetical protein
MIMGAAVRPYHFSLVTEDIRSRVQAASELVTVKPSAVVED